MKKLALILALLIPASAAAEDQCTTYEGKVSYVGPSGNIYKNTSIWMCVATAMEQCDSKGGYLYIRNGSRDHFALLSSSGAGLHSYFVATAPYPSPADPGYRSHKELHRLAVYRAKDAPPLELDMSVRYCKKTS